MAPNGLIYSTGGKVNDVYEIGIYDPSNGNFQQVTLSEEQLGGSINATQSGLVVSFDNSAFQPSELVES